MSKDLRCDICGGSKLVVSYEGGAQIQQGKIEGINTGFSFTLNMATASGHEVCANCARALRDAVTATVFQLKRPTVTHNV